MLLPDLRQRPQAAQVRGLISTLAYIRILIVCLVARPLTAGKAAKAKKSNKKNKGEASAGDKRKKEKQASPAKKSPTKKGTSGSGNIYVSGRLGVVANIDRFFMFLVQSNLTSQPRGGRRQRAARRV